MSDDKINQIEVDPGNIEIVKIKLLNDINGKLSILIGLLSESKTEKPKAKVTKKKTTK